MFHTNRLAEFIRRLRHDEGMDISMTMTEFKDGYYGVYKLVNKPKVSRVKTVLNAA